MHSQIIEVPWTNWQQAHDDQHLVTALENGKLLLLRTCPLK